ncbi:MAG TPA: ribonuclease H [Acidimicrobiales bacterium]|nr:ribonuclease H [Acidimicrobiales bacterium]
MSGTWCEIPSKSTTSMLARSTDAHVRAGPAFTVVYTDGACLGNPGPGGWAWAVPGGAYASGAAAHTTNQRMEMTAVLEALRVLLAADPPPAGIEVASDSAYVVNCFRQEWWKGWERRGWRNVAGKAVANRDLWEPLLALALDPARPVAFRWVKGHSGDRWNDFVDRLAVEAASIGRGTSGTSGT